MCFYTDVIEPSRENFLCYSKTVLTQISLKSNTVLFAPFVHCLNSTTLFSILYGPQREKTCPQGFVNNKGANQPARLQIPISTLLFAFLESINLNLLHA